MKEVVMGNLLIRCVAVGLVGLTTACSTVQTPSPSDPLEGFNRSVYKFNDVLDKAIVRPVAKGYQAALPDPVRGVIGNFFGNVGDVFIAVNNGLQGKPKDALSDAGRVVVNSTLGIVGLFDVATRLGLEKHDEDFGQTFGTWGVGTGPYLVLPFFGPSNVRDLFGLGFDTVTNPVGNVSDVAVRNSLSGTRLVDKRANLLEATDTLEKIALDPYSFVRDAYLARRQNLVYDGNPPRKKSDEEDYSVDD